KEEVGQLHASYGVVDVRDVAHDELPSENIVDRTVVGQLRQIGKGMRGLRGDHGCPHSCNRWRRVQYPTRSWVAPERIRTGVGRQLFAHALPVMGIAT